MTNIHTGIAVAFVLGFLLAVSSCRSSSELVVGGIYSVADEDGRFSVVKLLARGDSVCHVRVYKQKYKSRPPRIDLSTLSLGGIHDPDGFGMGHLPLREEAFRSWKPVHMSTATVTPEELEGYRMWKEAGSGVF